MNRLRRRCGLDRNELRRDVDRKQRSFALVLIAFYLAAAPAASLRSADMSYERGRQAERYEAATRHQVTATVTDPGSQNITVRRAIWVTWTGPDGRSNSGVAVAWRGKADKGEQQRIWVDATGEPTTRPRGRSQSVIDGWATGLGTSAGLTVPFMATYVIFRRRYDRRRYRDWDLAWSRLDSRSTN